MYINYSFSVDHDMYTSICKLCITKLYTRVYTLVVKFSVIANVQLFVSE